MTSDFEHILSEFRKISFSQKDKGSRFERLMKAYLLTDYKVLILTLNEHHVPPSIQKMITDSDQEINTNDASKLIGCINAFI